MSGSARCWGWTMAIGRRGIAAGRVEEMGAIAPKEERGKSRGSTSTGEGKGAHRGNCW